MTTPDLLYLALIAIGLCVDGFVLSPTFVRRWQADPGRARVWLCSSWMILFWTLVAAGGVLWLGEGRAWGLLRLTLPHGWRLLGAVGLVFALVIAHVPTVAKIARRKGPRRVRMPDYAAKMAPHTRSELGWWVALSLSVGFCEEFIFRGYLIWVFQPVLGLWGAAACSLVVFAAAHSYQGAKGVLAVGAVGGLLTVVVLSLGSLWPAIALHALLDAGQGLIAWLALRDVEGADSNLGTALN